VQTHLYANVSLDYVTIRFVIPCEDPFIEAGDTVSVFDRRITLSHHSLQDLRVVGVGPKNVIRDRFAQLLGEGVGEVIDMVCDRAQEDVPSEMDVDLPGNTIERIKRCVQA